MDLLAADPLTLAAAKGGVGKILLLRTSNHLSLSDPHSDQPSPSPISAVISPIYAFAPPPVKSNTYTIPRRGTLLRRKRRAKRKLSGGDSDGAGDLGLFLCGDDGVDFHYGGGGGFGGGGGGRWNFGRFGGEGQNWDDSSFNSYSDPAFDFVYQVLSWIMLSNCLHFAFKKIVRDFITDGIVDADREKVPRRLAPIC